MKIKVQHIVRCAYGAPCSGLFARACCGGWTGRGYIGEGRIREGRIEDTLTVTRVPMAMRVSEGYAIRFSAGPGGYVMVVMRKFYARTARST